MNQNLRVSKELVDYLIHLTKINHQDLQKKDFERGFKAGQYELALKVKSLFDQQNKEN